MQTLHKLWQHALIKANGLVVQRQHGSEHMEVWNKHITEGSYLPGGTGMIGMFKLYKVMQSSTVDLWGLDDGAPLVSGCVGHRK